MSQDGQTRFVIVGGGLGGALAACYLGRAGHQVDVYERRDDPRRAGLAGGRSINLAISHRGIEALRRVGLADRVLEMAVPMPGRMIHAQDGSLNFQPYGRDPSMAIHSVSRNGLNELLLRAADERPDVRLYFNHKCVDVDLASAAVDLVETEGNSAVRAAGDVVVSADGAFSAVRRVMQKLDRFDYSQSYLAHGYKELSIPPAPDGGFRLERNALHIWPRKALMMIALPNADGSFTCTIFWPFAGPTGFDAIQTKEALESFFDEQFPDAVPLMPTLVEDYFGNPTGSLVTIRCGPWYYRDRAVLLGDACHAVVPFYGQGANAAFEDVLVLDECMQRHESDRERAFAEYYQMRKHSVDTLADLAIHNFVEMRDHTGSRVFVWKKRGGNWLNGLFPRWYLPLYTMVTFTRMPYDAAVRRARRQSRVAAIAAGVLVFLIVAAVWWTAI